MLESLIPFLLTLSGVFPAHFHLDNSQLPTNELRVHIESVFEMVDEPKRECFINLLLGTAATESTMGANKGNEQYDFGVFQINYATEKDFTERVLSKYPKYKKVIEYYRNKYGVKQCRGILEYQILLAMLVYKERIPLVFENDVWTMAWYWKKYYNSVKGKGTTTHFYSKYKLYIEEG